MGNQKNNASATEKTVAEAFAEKLATVAPDLVAEFEAVVADHATRFETVSAELKATKEALESSEKLVEELSEKAEAKVAVKQPDLPTVKIGKTTYKVMYPKISFEGNIITAEDLVSNPDACEALIEMESGALVPVQ